MKNKRFLIPLSILVIALACNLPANNGAPTNPITPLTGPGVQITSPENGTQLSAETPVIVSYQANGGPFIEVDLSVDGQFVASSSPTSQDAVISGTIGWSNPNAGVHMLQLQVVTSEKKIYSSSVQVSITGGSSPSVTNTAPIGTPTVDAAQETARQRVIQILHDQYGINMSAPPVGHKVRYGVTTDPWNSAIYFNNWFINISLYPDGSESVYADPLNGIDPNSNPGFLSAGGKESKAIHMCRPSSVIKLLVVFVDHQNTGITQQETTDGLNQAVSLINGKYTEASRAVGVQTPILQLQVTGSFLAAPPPDLPANGLLTPNIAHASTGNDPSQFDVLAQVDLDSTNHVADTYNSGSHGFATSGCGGAAYPPFDVNMWIGIDKKENLTNPNADFSLTNILGHEILHTMGYPIGKTGLHEWICWDGTVIDATDQCDQNNLPTYMMGWTDTDGDGVVEILDPTPYGYLPP